MQDCFREHPDVYGAELADDEEEGQEAEDAQTGAPAPAPVAVEGREVPTAEDARAGAPAPAPAPTPISVEGGEVPAAATSAEPAQAPSPAVQPPPSTSSATSGDVTQQRSADEGNVLVPKAAHDATPANTEK